LINFEPNAEIVQRIVLTDYLIILKIKPRGWTIPDFDAGQFTQLGLSEAFVSSHAAPEESLLVDADKLIKRSYSIASAPQVRDYVEFYINLVPGGHFTPALFTLAVGDTLWMNPQFEGRLTLTDMQPDKRLILISTGTGIGPLMSMLRAGLLNNRPAPVDFIHGVRFPADLAYADELTAAALADPNFRYHPVVSRPEQSVIPWTGATGHVQNIWRREIDPLIVAGSLTPENTQLFLCGNPAMIQDMLTLLETHSFTRHLPRRPGQVHIERYW